MQLSTSEEQRSASGMQQSIGSMVSRRMRKSRLFG